MLVSKTLINRSVASAGHASLREYQTLPFALLHIDHLSSWLDEYQTLRSPRCASLCLDSTLIIYGAGEI